MYKVQFSVQCSMFDVKHILSVHILVFNVNSCCRMYDNQNMVPNILLSEKETSNCQSRSKKGLSQRK